MPGTHAENILKQTAVIKPWTFTGEIPSLSGIRGFAALWVMAMHIWQFMGAPAWMLGQVWLTPLIASGAFGVDLFFVLSGFLLGRPYMRAALNGTAWPSAKVFWLRRCRRVLPAYWLQLIVLLFVGGVGTYSFWQVAAHFTLTFNIVKNVSSINPVYWSMPVEWNFYMILPLICLLFKNKNRILWLLLGSIVFAILFRVACWQALFFFEAEAMGFFRLILQIPARIDQFVLGIAAAWCVMRFPAPRPWVRHMISFAAPLLLLITIYVTNWHGDVLDASRVPWAYVQLTLTATACAGLIYSAALGHSVFCWIWQSRVMVFLGAISYSLYLWHFPILNWLQKTPVMGWKFAFSAVLLSVLIATLSWRFVEKPFLAK